MREQENKDVKILKELIQSGVIVGEEVEAVERAITALNQSNFMIPNKQDSDIYGKEVFLCPTCGLEVKKKNHYCSECGTHLDWDGYLISCYIDENAGNEEVCKYCMYDEDCPKGVVGGPNGPRYPYCVDGDIESYLDFDGLLRVLKNRGKEDIEL
jgi:hypothetical protein